MCGTRARRGQVGGGHYNTQVTATVSRLCPGRGCGGPEAEAGGRGLVRAARGAGPGHRRQLHGGGGGGAGLVGLLREEDNSLHWHCH